MLAQDDDPAARAEPSVDRMAAGVLARLESQADPERVAVAERYVKMGPGEYGERDVFLGVRVPTLRTLARELRGFPIEEAVRLLQSDYHEARLLALFLLVDAYQKGDEPIRERVF